MFFWSIVFVIIALSFLTFGLRTLLDSRKETSEKSVILSFISICLSVFMFVYTVLFNIGALIDPGSFLESILSPIDTSNIPLDAVAFNGHSYYLYDPEESTWDEVLRNCASKQGYPAVVNNKEENKFLYNYMIEKGKDAAFFGYKDIDNEEDWKWVYGKKSSYEKWGTNSRGQTEPNQESENEDWAQFNTRIPDYGWNDSEYGIDTYCYICEWNGVRK